MAVRQKKGFKESIDDVLGDLLGDDGEPVKSRAPVRVPKGGALTSRSSKRSLLDDEFFSRLAEEAGAGEASDVSEADAQALLESMKDMDDMDADLFGPKKKPSSAPAQSARKPSGVKAELKAEETDQPGPQEKPRSAPAAPSRSYRKFSFGDTPGLAVGDTAAPQTCRDASVEDTGKRDEHTAPPTGGPRKREEFTFDDDDDLMDTLGFGEAGQPERQRDKGVPQPARTRLDEILGRGTSPRLLERPSTGDKEQLQEKRTTAKDSFPGEEEFTFGSYQPSAASEGRESRRQSVRFSLEDVRSPKSATPTSPANKPRKQADDWLELKPESQSAEAAPKQDPPISAGSERPAGGSPDSWLGLKQESQLEGGRLRPSVPASPPAAQHSSAKQDGEAGRQTEGVAPAAHTPTTVENRDWLSGALSRKQSAAAMRSSTNLGDEKDMQAPHSSKASPPSMRRAEDTLRRQAPPPAPQWLVTEDGPGPVPQQHASHGSTDALRPQVQLSAESLQQLLVQQQLLWGAGGSVDTAALRQRKERELQPEELLQTRLIRLEGQVRTLQLERDQMQMLLESVQQRHQQDTQLLENAHRARVKLLEESAAQREARAQQDKEDAVERLAAATRVAEQERVELQAQYQRRLGQIQQDRDREVERLRELQRKSILEMKQDHEEQLQRLKRLKDEEIDAVTSATSQTRSLTVVIEQMELFSQRLGELSLRVESTHEHTAQGLEHGARQRDEQLKVMQQRLEEQHRATAEERARLNQVISKMDTQLAEQQRQLEKERWRVSAEQAKAESAQRMLEEERRSLTQHISMEREELERAKSALLEEQQSVMQRCGEERRKLAAERAELSSQQKLWQERVERESSQALERSTHREGSILSMVQEQAELKLRAGDVKQREEALAREKADVERQRAEVEREKEALSSAALRMKSRAQEVEQYSQLASQRYEEGERALQDARRLEAQHQSRLRTIHTQMERLREQELHLHKERIRVTQQRLTQHHPTPVPPAQLVFPSQPAAPPPNPAAMEMQAQLALLKHTAEKDRDFLQDEQFFLQTLTKASYNSPCQTV